MTNITQASASAKVRPTAALTTGSLTLRTPTAKITGRALGASAKIRNMLGTIHVQH
jgi:hypothetical protein